jgi:hypothetical protein
MTRSFTSSLFASIALLLLAPQASPQGIQVALLPQVKIVGAGSGFDIDLAVPSAGSSFNAFEAIVQYDPAMLTFVPASPTSLQQGSSMTGACGNTFHLFGASNDSLSMTVSLLCAGVSLTGPSQIYRLHFVAGNTAGVTTTIKILHAAFYDAGVRVLPVTTADDTVKIHNPVGVDPDPLGSATIELRAAPNPSVSGTTLLLNSAVPGEQSLLVSDIAGRVVRRLGSGRFDAGRRAVAWDGRDDAGRAVPPGVYLARYLTPAGMRQTRLVVLR